MKAGRLRRFSVRNAFLVFSAFATLWSASIVKLSAREQDQIVQPGPRSASDRNVRTGQAAASEARAETGQGRRTEPVSPPPGALPDPVHLMMYQDGVYAFWIKGRTSGPVFGSDIYGETSHIGSAAVHAGVLKPDEVGLVTLEVFSGGPERYEGTERNGVRSQNANRYKAKSYRFRALTSQEQLVIDQAQKARADKKAADDAREKARKERSAIMEAALADEANALTASLTTSLIGLAAATKMEAKINSVFQRPSYMKHAPSLAKTIAPEFYLKRREILRDPRVQAEFTAAMMALPRGSDPRSTVEDAAETYVFMYDYAGSHDQTIPAFEAGIRAGINEQIAKGVVLSDASGQNEAGPSAMDMLRAVNTQVSNTNRYMDAVVEKYRRQGGANTNDLDRLQCILITGTTDGNRSLVFTITHFGKLSCEPARRDEGFQCWFYQHLQSNSPHGQGAIGAALGHSKLHGRFVPGFPVWRYTEIQ